MIGLTIVVSTAGAATLVAEEINEGMTVSATKITSILAAKKWKTLPSQRKSQKRLIHGLLHR